MSNKFRYILLLIVSASCLGAHEPDELAASNKWSNEAIELYPFKNRIDDLCKGHGVAHMTSDELNEYNQRIAEHYPEMIDLVTGDIKDDNYLYQLTHFIKDSTLEKSKKDEFYKKGYLKYKEQAEEGNQFRRSLLLLLRNADIFTPDELKIHMGSDDKWVKDAAQKSLARTENRARNNNVAEKVITNSMSNQSKGSDSLGNEYIQNNQTYWPYYLSGGILISAIAGYFILKRK